MSTTPTRCRRLTRSSRRTSASCSSERRNPNPPNPAPGGRTNTRTDSDHVVEAGSLRQTSLSIHGNGASCARGVCSRVVHEKARTTVLDLSATMVYAPPRPRCPPHPRGQLRGARGPAPTRPPSPRPWPPSQRFHPSAIGADSRAQPGEAPLAKHWTPAQEVEKG